MGIDKLIKQFFDAKQLVEWGAPERAISLYKEIIDTPDCPEDLRTTVRKELATLQPVQEVTSPQPQSVPSATQVPAQHTPQSDELDTARVHYIDPYAITPIEAVEKLMPVSDSTYAEVKEDIRARGIQTPLIVTPNFRLLCGYNRLRIAKELELKSVPIIIKDIPEKDIVSYAILDNIKRRQLTRDQIMAYIGSLPVAKVGRPSKGSRRKVNKDIAKALGVSARTVARARAYARKLKDNPALVGKSIRSVLGGDEHAHAVQTSEYTIGVDDQRMVSDFGNIIENLFGFDVHPGDRLKLVIQAYHMKRG